MPEKTAISIDRQTAPHYSVAGTGLVAFAQELVRLSVVPLRGLGAGCQTLGDAASATCAIQTVIGRLAVSLSKSASSDGPSTGEPERRDRGLRGQSSEVHLATMQPPMTVPDSTWSRRCRRSRFHSA
jgi:hypothetical protein